MYIVLIAIRILPRNIIIIGVAGLTYTSMMETLEFGGAAATETHTQRAAKSQNIKLELINN